jgi:hypothetical protein
MHNKLIDTKTWRKKLGETYHLLGKGGMMMAHYLNSFGFTDLGVPFI